jgi:hypothetical protein
MLRNAVAWVYSCTNASRDGFVGTVIEQSRRGSVLCQWLNSVADDDLSIYLISAFAAADLVSCGGGEWLDRHERTFVARRCRSIAPWPPVRNVWRWPPARSRSASPGAADRPPSPSPKPRSLA